MPGMLIHLIIKMAQQKQKLNKQLNTRNHLKILIESGIENVENLSKLCNTSLSTVKRVKRALRENRGVERKPGGGRPSILKMRDKLRVARLVVLHPKYSATRIAEKAHQLGSPMVNRMTIYRYCESIGYKKWTPKPGPMLTEAHKRNRIAWCRKYRHFDWSKVVFTDESYFQLFRAKCMEWSKKRPLKPTPKHSPATMVWGGISLRGVTLLKMARGSINSEKYTEILQENLLQQMNTLYPDGWVLQQDNASCHNSRFTRKWLVDNKIEVIEWPACSPDLNPIENVWGIMKDIIEKQEPNNMNDFNTAIADVWDKLSIELLKALIESMPKRIEECIAANGGKINY
jgi:transposase